MAWAGAVEQMIDLQPRQNEGHVGIGAGGRARQMGEGDGGDFVLFCVSKKVIDGAYGGIAR